MSILHFATIELVRVKQVLKNNLPGNRRDLDVLQV
jgi:hypothetical protein